jgi:predicted dehydrogenase
LKVPTAILGLGKIGLTYDLDKMRKPIPNQIMTHCRSVSKSDYFAVSYLIDLQIDKVRLGVELYGGTGFQTVAEAEGPDLPQLVIVSVPTSIHSEILYEIAEKWKPTTYLIEKPFGGSSYEARQMESILNTQGANVYVNYLRRYLPNFNSLKLSQFFRNRGNLHSVVINGYGTLENIFSHFLDLLIFIESDLKLGSSVKSKFTSSPENLRFLDSDSGILFEFNGVGESMRECEMTLYYESLVIAVIANGRNLEIQDLKGSTIAAFNIDNSIFDSYQAIVLQRISDEFGQFKVNTSIAEAIRIHEFIESI